MERAFDPKETYLPDNSTSRRVGEEPVPFSVGQRLKDQGAQEYLFVEAGATITAGQVCVVDADGEALPITAARAKFGRRVGVAVVNIADESFGWLSIYGTGDVSVGAACAADTKLATTGNGGVLDDAAGNGTVNVENLVLKTARGAGAGTAAGMWSYPFVGSTN